MTTFEELCEAVRCGSNLSIEDMAQRILLAQQSDNIVGGVSVDHLTGAITANDNATKINKPPLANVGIEEVHNGGTYRQAWRIADLFAEIGTLKTNQFGAGSISNITNLAINPLNLAAWQAVVTSYFNSTENIVIDIDLLAEHLYCNSLGVGIIQYALAKGHTEAEIDYLSQFVAEIPTSTLSEWYAEGKSTPLSNYLAYECATRPDVEGVYTVSDYSARRAVYIPLSLWNFDQSRAIRVTLSGNFSSISEPQKKNDVFYEVDASGVVSVDTNDFRLRMSPSNEDIRDVTPEYNENGDYVFTAVIDANNHASIEFTNQRNPPFISDPQGEISILIQDLGSI